MNQIVETHRENARDYWRDGDDKRAKKSYEAILRNWIPNDWEAILRRELCVFNLADIPDAYKYCDDVSNAIKTSINLICDSDIGIEDKIEALNFIKKDLEDYHTRIFMALSKTACYRITREERKVVRSKALSIFFDIADTLDAKLSESKIINEICVEYWKLAIEDSIYYDGRYVSAEYCEQAKKHIPMVLKYDKSYIAPDIKVYVEKKPSKFKVFLSKIISFKDLSND